MSMIPTLRRLTRSLRSPSTVASSRQSLRFVAVLALLAVFALLAQAAAHAAPIPFSFPQSVTVLPSINTIAGNGTQGLSGNGGLATSAEFNNPVGAVVDSAGNLYIADYGNNVVRMVAARTETILGQSVTASDIYTIAGNGTWGFSGDGGLATSAQLKQPQGVALDSAGNLYIADTFNCVIRVVAAATGTIMGQSVTAGDIYTVAGTGGVSGYSGDGAAATSAELKYPTDMALDSTGNLYIVDNNNNVIRVVAASTGTILGQSVTAGDIYTVAGTGAAGYSGDGAAATSAAFYYPTGIALDSAGNIYIADSSNNVIRVVAAVAGTIFGQSVTAGDIYTVAGTGTAGYSGNGAAATSAELSNPAAISLDSAGDIYIADMENNRIRVVAAGTGTVMGQSTTAGDIYTVSGVGSAGYAGDGGPAINAELNSLQGVAVDSAGNLYIADSNNQSIREISTITTLPTTAVGSASVTQNVYVQLNGFIMVSVSSISVPTAQNGAQEFTVGAVTGCSFTAQDPSGSICTIPITFNPQYPGPRTGALTLYSSGTTILGTVGLSGIATGPLGVFSPGTATTTSISGMVRPVGIATDIAGDIFLADSDKNAIFEVSANGATSTVNTGSPGGTAIYIPTGVAVDGAGNLYIADEGNGRVVELSASGVASVVNTGSLTAATGIPCGNTPLCKPSGVAVGGAGNLYIADTYYNRIVEITPSGAVSVVATGAPGGESLSYPNSLTVDAAGDLYIADSGNNRIVEVTAAGTASVINTGSFSLSSPSSVAVDAAGDLYIADGANSRIVEVTVSGAASVVNTGSVTMKNAYGVAVDGAGNIDIADSSNKELLQISPTASALTFASTVVGSTSSDSPQAVTVANIGNAPLTFTALAATANFDLNGAGATCTNSSSLNAGDTCGLGIDFAPTAVGSLAGTVNITDNSLNVAANVQQVSLSGTGTIAATTTTLTASASSITAGQSVTFTATVTAGGVPVTSGTVNFYNGTTSLGTGALNASGVASFTTSTLAAGGDPAFTATYAGTANDAGSTSSTVTVTVSAAPIAPSYTMTANPTSLTIAAGSTGTTTLTFTPVGGYTGSVTLSCGTLPSFVTCAFTQGSTTNSTVTMNGSNTPITVTLTISTNVATAMNVLPSILQTPGARPAALLAATKTPTPMNPILPALAFCGPGGLAGLAVFGKKKKLTKKQFGLLQLGLLVLLTGAMAAGISGCGSSGTASSNLHTTPAGISTVVITAAPTSGSSQTLNLSVTITG